MIGDFTRGGQIELHSIRMLFQVFKKIVLIYFAIILLIFGYRLYFGSSKIDNYKDFIVYEIAKLDCALSKNIGYYSNSNIKPKNTIFKNSYKIVNNLKYRINSLYIIKTLKNDLTYSILIGLIIISLVIIYLIYFGKKKVKSKNLRGSKIFNIKDANNYLKKHNIRSEYRIGDLHLVKNKETSHILFTGTTGSGKSNAMFHLIPQIRDSTNHTKNHIIIVDFTGEMVARYFQKEYGDKIIDPVNLESESESKTVNYDFLGDTKDQNSLSIILNALFSGSNLNKGDNFWDESAKSLFKDLVNYCNENGYDINYLYKLVHNESLEELHKVLKGYAAANIIDPKNDKTSISIRAHLIAYTGFLEFLIKKAANETISIKDWFENIKNQVINDNSNINNNKNQRNPILFLTSSPITRSRVKNLYSMIIDLIISNIMNLGPDADRRIWIILDELPALSYLPSLPIALSEGRKYGCCIVAGIQSIHQLHNIYGNNISKTMIDQFGTKFIFRTEDEVFASYVGSIFGKKEYEELKESISYGANDMRDGVSLSRDKIEKPLVSLSDLSRLNDLEAFVKLPDQNVKIVKLQMKYYS